MDISYPDLSFSQLEIRIKEVISYTEHQEYFPILNFKNWVRDISNCSRTISFWAILFGVWDISFRKNQGFF